jgi:hypothetical protein
MLYSGIDLHKRSLVIHTLDAEGGVAREAELAAHRRAVIAYFATLPGPHRAVVDACRAGIGSVTCWRLRALTSGSGTRSI